MGQIGLHIERVPNVNRLFRCIDIWKPADVILVGDGIHVKHDLRNRYPNLRIWLRFHDDDDTSRRIFPDYNRYVEKIVSRVENRDFYLATDNEPLWREEAVEWWTNVARECTERGVRVALPAFSVGTPPTENINLPFPTVIRRTLPLLQELVNGNHALRLNEYWGIHWTSGTYHHSPNNYPEPIVYLDMDRHIGNHKGWHCGRWRQWINKVGNELNGQLNILIGEHGPDTLHGDDGLKEYWAREAPKLDLSVNTVVETRNKWNARTCEPIWRELYPNMSMDRVYGNMLILAAQHYYNEPNVLGQCVFVYSDEKPRWAGFNIARREELWDIVGEYNSRLIAENQGQVVNPEPVINITAPPAIDWTQPANPEEDNYTGFWCYRGRKWATDSGEYANSYYGVAEAVNDYFGDQNELWIKAAHGDRLTGWIQGAYTEQFRIGNVYDAQAAVGQVYQAGLRSRFWTVPLAEDDEYEQEVTNLVNVSNAAYPYGLRGVVLRLEPYSSMWGGYRKVGLARDYINMLRDGLDERIEIWAAIDARRSKMSELRWDEWEEHITRVDGECFWNEFKRPAKESYITLLSDMRRGLEIAGEKRMGMVFPDYPVRVQRGGEWQWQEMNHEESLDAFKWARANNYPFSIFTIRGLKELRRLAHNTGDIW